MLGAIHTLITLSSTGLFQQVNVTSGNGHEAGVRLAMDLLDARDPNESLTNQLGTFHTIPSGERQRLTELYQQLSAHKQPLQNSITRLRPHVSQFLDGQGRINTNPTNITSLFQRYMVYAYAYLNYLYYSIDGRSSSTARQHQQYWQGQCQIFRNSIPDYFWDIIATLRQVNEKIRQAENTTDPATRINRLTEALNLIGDNAPYRAEPGISNDLQYPGIRRRLIEALSNFANSINVSLTNTADTSSLVVDYNPNATTQGEINPGSVVSSNLTRINNIVSSIEQLRDFQQRVNAALTARGLEPTNHVVTEKTSALRAAIIGVVNTELSAAGFSNGSFSALNNSSPAAALIRWRHLKNADRYLQQIESRTNFFNEQVPELRTRINNELAQLRNQVDTLYTSINQLCELRNGVLVVRSNSNISAVRELLNANRNLFQLYQKLKGHNLQVLLDSIAAVDQQRQLAEERLRQARELLQNQRPNLAQDTITAAENKIREAQEHLDRGEYTPSIEDSDEAMRIINNGLGNIGKINQLIALVNRIPNYHFSTRAKLFLAIYKLTNGQNSAANNFFQRWGFPVTMQTTAAEIDSFANTRFPNLTRLCQLFRNYNATLFNSLANNPQTTAVPSEQTVNSFTGYDTNLTNRSLTTEAAVNSLYSQITEMELELNNNDNLAEARLAFNIRLAILSENYLAGAGNTFRERLQRIRWAGYFNSYFQNYNQNTGFSALSAEENNLLRGPVNSLNLIGRLQEYRNIQIMTEYLSMITARTGMQLSDRAALMGTTVSRKAFTVGGQTLNAYIYTLDHRFHDSTSAEIDVIIQLDNGQNEIRINGIDIVNGVPEQTKFYLVRRDNGTYRYSSTRENPADLEIDLATLESQPLNIIRNSYVPGHLGLNDQRFLGRQYSEIIASERDRDDNIRNYTRPYRQQLAVQGFIPALMFYELDYMNNDIGFWGNNSAKFALTYLFLRRLGVSQNEIINEMADEYTVNNNIAARWLPGNNRYIDVAVSNLRSNRRHEMITVTRNNSAVQVRIGDATDEELVTEVYRRLEQLYTTTSNNITESQAILRRLLTRMNVLTETKINGLLR